MSLRPQDASAFRAFAQSDDLGDPKRYAQEMLGIIAKQGSSFGMEPADVAETLASNYDQWSMNHTYYKTQAIALRFVGPLGTTVIFLVGVGALVAIVVNTTSKVYNWLATHVQTLFSFFGTVEHGIAGFFKGLFGIKNDAMRDAAAAAAGLPSNIDPSAFAMAIAGALPGPLGFIVSATSTMIGPVVGSMTPPAGLSNGLGLITSGSAAASGSAGSQAAQVAAGSSTPAASAAASAAASTSASNASGSNGVASLVSAGVSGLSSLGTLISSFTGSSDASTAAAAGSASADLSSALDTGDASSVDDLGSALDSGSADDISSTLDNIDASADSAFDAAGSYNQLVRALGASGARAVASHLVRIHRATRGGGSPRRDEGYRTVRNQSSSGW